MKNILYILGYIFVVFAFVSLDKVQAAEVAEKTVQVSEQVDHKANLKSSVEYYFKTFISYFTKPVKVFIARSWKRFKDLAVAVQSMLIKAEHDFDEWSKEQLQEQKSIKAT